MTTNESKFEKPVEPGWCWCCQDGIADWGEILVGRILNDMLVGNVEAWGVYPIARWVKMGMRRTDAEYAVAALEEGGLIRSLGGGWFQVLDIEADPTEPGSGESEAR